MTSPSLDAAWADAESAKREWFDWQLAADPDGEFFDESDFASIGLRLEGQDDHWTAMVMDWTSSDIDGQLDAEGPTPEAALTALAAAVRREVGP
jgi:hypothetical protein